MFCWRKLRWAHAHRRQVFKVVWEEVSGLCTRWKMHELHRQKPQGERNVKWEENHYLCLHVLSQLLVWGDGSCSNDGDLSPAFCFLAAECNYHSGFSSGPIRKLHFMGVSAALSRSPHCDKTISHSTSQYLSSYNFPPPPSLYGRDLWHAPPRPHHRRDGFIAGRAFV